MNSENNNLHYEYVAARIILMYLKLIGLAPYSIRRSPEWKQSKMDTLQDSTIIKCSSSPFGCIYNLCLITTHLIVVYTITPFLLTVEYTNKSALTTLIEIISWGFGNCILFVIWLIFGFRQKTAAKLLNRLLSVDRVMFFLNCRHLPESSNYFIIFLFVTYSTLLIGLLLTNWLVCNNSILSNFLYILPSIIFLSYVFQYTFIIKLIENRFRAINRAFHDRLIVKSVDITYYRFPARNFSKDQSSAPKIATLRRAYISLCEITSEISDFNSLPILLTILYLCFVFLYNAYYIVVPFVIIMDSPSIMNFINSLFWLLNEILPIVILASGVTNAVKESRKTADIVWKLLTISNSRHSDNEQLEHFSLELLHRKVQFSVCGLFSLDSTIVHSIYSMIITYLIILLQYQMGKSTND